MAENFSNVVSNVLVLLYHSPGFKERILNAQVPNEISDVAVTKSVFKAMAGETDSEGRVGDPAIRASIEAFTECIKPKLDILNGQDTFDLYEVLMVVLDHLDTLLKKHNPLNPNRDLFSCFDIKLKNFIACNNCGNYSEKVESTLSIPISAKKGSVYGGIEDFKALEQIDGYWCSGCKRKDVVADRGTLLHSLSDTVLVQLKRTDFDYDTMQRVKLYDKVHFDLKLSGQKLELEGGAEYELFATVVHLGTASQGHNHILVRGSLGGVVGSETTSPVAWPENPYLEPADLHLHNHWIKFGDFKTQPISSQDVAKSIGPGVLCPLAYILAYKRVGAPVAHPLHMQ